MGFLNDDENVLCATIDLQAKYSIIWNVFFCKEKNKNQASGCNLAVFFSIESALV
jgi:hypothetical protein